MRRQPQSAAPRAHGRAERRDRREAARGAASRRQSAVPAAPSQSSDADWGDEPSAATALHPQSACLRRKAGISISSMPLLASASTFAAAWLRALRHTLGVLSPV